MARTPGLFRTTVAGGVLFLLPIIVVIFFLGKGIEIAQRLSRPVVRAIGVESVAGVAFGSIVAVGLLLLVAFLAGLIARTKLGQTTISMIEHSILGVLPQFRMARGLVQSFDPERHADVEVVLVPTDAGWCLGIVLEHPEGDWWSVFVPGAPDWTSGSVAYAHSDQVHPTGLSFAQAIMLMRRCGTGSANIRELLSRLHDKGEV